MKKLKSWLGNLKLVQKMILFSAIAVTVLWMGTAAIFGCRVSWVYNEKINVITEQTVKQTSNYVNTEFNNIINLVHYSAVAQDLQSVLSLEVNGNRRDYIQAQSIIVPILTQLRVQNSYIDSTGMKLNESWFYGDNYPMNYNVNDLMEEARTSPLIYWSKETIYNSGTGNNVLPVILRVPNAQFSLKNEAYMVININADRLESYLEELEKSLNCHLLIQDGEQVIIGGDWDSKWDESNYIVNDSPININGWTITCIMDRDVLYQDYYDTIRWMVALSAVLLLLYCGADVCIAKTVTEPLRVLTHQAEQFENGDFSARSNIDGNDEVGQLGKSFNSMCTQIEEYIEMLEAEKQEIARIEEAKRKEQMRVLQAQINPHFIYNTLDSLYWFSLSDKKEEAGRLVLNLSRMLKIGLSKGSDSIPVERELEHVKNYLELEKIIFPDKFTYEISCPPEALHYRIVKVILQPLVENCIVHGFQNIDSQGKILVKVEIRDGNMVFRVEDNGCGFTFSEKQKKEAHNGYAMLNVQKRLELYYGNDAKTRIESVPYEKTAIEISIALKRMG